MKTKVIDQYFKKYLEPFFAQHGFVLSALNDSGYEVIKKDNDVLFRCPCSKLRSRKGIVFEAFAIYICFEKIENTLKDILHKYELEDSPYTLRSYDNEGTKEHRRQVRAVEIATEADFAQYADAVKQYCNDIVFPFFDRYKSVEALNGYIKEIPEDDLTYHIGGEFQLKKMIVLKWCNDPEYDNYAEYVRQKFESIKDLDDGKYIPLLKAYYELAERLKEGI
jgi:hypothetical protein